VNIEFHNTLVSHFQQEGLAGLLVQDIRSSHDLMNLERFFAQSIQDIVAIIEHAFFLTITGTLLKYESSSSVTTPGSRPCRREQSFGAQRGVPKIAVLLPGNLQRPKSNETPQIPAESARMRVFLETRGLRRLLGGRTKARTWGPLIKRHTVCFDLSREFFQLNQNSHDWGSMIYGKKSNCERVQVG
jgi:hypothetical protein